MLMVVQKRQISNIIMIPNIFCCYNFALKSLPGGVPDQALLLAVGVAGHHPDGHGRPETTIFKHYYHHGDKKHGDSVFLKHQKKA